MTDREASDAKHNHSSETSGQKQTSNSNLKNNQEEKKQILQNTNKNNAEIPPRPSSKRNMNIVSQRSAQNPKQPTTDPQGKA